MSFEEKTMKSDKLYEGKLINLRIDTVELPDKKYSKREIVEHPGAVAIVALDQEGNIILVEQYRKAIEKVLLEIPAGKIDLGEEPREAAIRELREETGYDVDKLEYLFEFYSSSGFSNEKIHVFYTNSIRKISDQVGCEGEYLRIRKMKFEEAVHLVKLGDLRDSKTNIGLMYVNSFIER